MPGNFQLDMGAKSSSSILVSSNVSSSPCSWRCKPMGLGSVLPAKPVGVCALVPHLGDTSPRARAGTSTSTVTSGLGCRPLIPSCISVLSSLSSEKSDWDESPRSRKDGAAGGSARSFPGMTPFLAPCCSSPPLSATSLISSISSPSSSELPSRPYRLKCSTSNFHTPVSPSYEMNLALSLAQMLFNFLEYFSTSSGSFVGFPVALSILYTPFNVMTAGQLRPRPTGGFSESSG
mmetsp:Transcript_119/g.316  ORF Transcript_119/g.316 Transcript_119/m.316 type:complete len:234 (-) Transcript_119:438-1139(-)